MTQIFNDEGNLVPVTVMRIDPNVVIATKTKEKDGYAAVLLGVDDMKPIRVTKPYAGQFAPETKPKKRIREFRDFEKEVNPGDALGVELLADCRYVDVTGISKGQSTYPGKTFKNVKLPGHMGREQVTVLSLRVVKVDTEKRLIMVNGAVPGINKGTVIIRAAVKK